MSVRDSFLSNFDSVSTDFAEHTAIYFVSQPDSKSSAVSFSDLKCLSDKIAVFLSRIVTEGHEYFGVCLTDNIWLPCILLSVWQLGKAFAGIDRNWKCEQKRRFVESLNVKHIITDDGNDKQYNAFLVDTFVINNTTFYVWCTYEKTERQAHWDMCYGIMTSGSTGDPKVIEVPWSCIMPNVDELKILFCMSSFDRIYQSSPYTFDPFFIELFLALTTGASLVIISNHLKFSSDCLLNVLFNSESDISDVLTDDSPPCSTSQKKENQFLCSTKEKEVPNITFLQTTPSLFKRWKVDDIKNTILSKKSSLRTLVLGGEKFSIEIMNFKDKDNLTRIFNIYGITEMSCWAFINEVQSNKDEKLGRALQDVIHKLDSNQQSGELLIGSNARKCIVNNEQYSQDDEIVFRRTGDFVQVINSELFFVSRTDQVVKKFGTKVNLQQIENLFFVNISILKACCCIFDESSLKLGMFIVFSMPHRFPKDLSILACDDIVMKDLQVVNKTLNDIEKPDYFIELNDLPLNSHGKCDRRLLLRHLRDLIQSQVVSEQSDAIFKDVWCHVLNTKQPSGNFVNLGGSSVSALQMVAKLEDMHVHVPRNFVSALLSNGSFDDCLAALQDEPTTKRRKTDDSGTDRNLLEKLTVAWTFETKKCVDASPAIIKDSCVIVGSHSSRLSCLELKTGIEKWTLVLGDRIESKVCLNSSAGVGFVGCYDHHLYCISIPDGFVLWKYQTGDMVKSTPFLSTDETRVFVASYDHHLHCLTAADGSLLKKVKLSDSGVYSSGVISNELNAIYIATLNGTCLSLNEQTLNISWKHTLKSPVFASPCLVTKNGPTRIVFAEVIGVVHCFAADTGVQLWTFECEGNIYSSLTNLQDSSSTFLMFGCHDSCLYCLQVDLKPQLKWKLKLDSAVFSTPAEIRLSKESENRICVATTKGWIYICDAASSLVLSKLQLQGEIFSSPVFCKSRLFVGCRDNNLYCLQIT